MEKLNLTVEEIFNKEFNIEFKGYSAKEVDYFLDLILNDYQVMLENIETLQNQKASLEAELKLKEEQILDLESKNKFTDIANTTNYSSVDLLKRVSRLEEEVFKNH